MRNFLKIGDFDPLPGLSALSRQEALWNAFNIRTTYPNSPHAEADDILLWFNDLTDPEGVVNDLEVQPYPAWAVLPQLRPVVFDVMRRVEGFRLGRVMVTRLAPGRRIHPHEDQGAPASYFKRYHFALKSAPGCIFRCEDEAVTMASGEVWWFDNTKTHSVENNSADDRIVMIADIACA